MTFLRTLISCAVIAAAITLEARVTTQNTANSAVIQGIVSRTTTGEPVQGVTVTAASDSGSKYTSTTDISGTFSFKGIAAGHYSLSANRSGFLPYDKEQHYTGVTVSPGQELKELRIRLTPTGSIEGRVLDRSGRPVVGATVMAIRPTFINGRRVLVPDLAFTGLFLPIGSRVPPAWEYPKASTDDRGRYRIYGMPPGGYYVSVWSAGTETLDEVTGQLDKDPDSSKAQPPTYYPGVTDPGYAIPVTVNGTELQGVDLELPVQTLHRFTFQLVPSITPPEPCRGIGNAQESIVLVHHTQNLDVIQYSSRFGNRIFKKGDDNQWTSPQLPPGSYDVFFNPCMFNDLAAVGALTTNIVDRGVDAGKLVIPSRSTIFGQIRKTEAPSVEFKQIQLRLRPLDLRTASTSMVPRAYLRMPVKTDGTFGFDFYRSDGSAPLSSTAPEYQLDIAGLPEDVYVASVRLGGREVRDTGFRLDAEPPGPLEVSLSDRGGLVRGEVKDSAGKPAVDSFVALMPFNRDLVYSNLYRETRTGQDGTFAIRGIPPGEYAILAAENLETGESRSADFRNQTQSRSLKIIVKEGSLETVSLTSGPR